MQSILKIAKLDFYTLKGHMGTYLSFIFMCIYFGVMNVLEIMYSPVNTFSIIASGFAPMVVLNVFALQERFELNKLYGTLAVNSNDVVKGRYIFSLLNFLAVFLIAFVLSLVFNISSLKNLNFQSAVQAFALSFFIFSFIEGIQLPIYFKLGAIKGRIYAMIPFLAMIFIAFAWFNLSAVLYSNLNLLYTLALLGGIAIMLVSYKISEICCNSNK